MANSVDTETAARVRDPQRLKALCELWQSAEQDVWITLQGGSMAPTLRPGSRLRLRCRSQEPALGDVVAFRRDGRLVVHRLICVHEGVAPGRRELICQGDANPGPDEPITPEMVVGVVAEVQPPALVERVRRKAEHQARRVRRVVRRLWRGVRPPSRGEGASR